MKKSTVIILVAVVLVIGLIAGVTATVFFAGTKEIIEDKIESRVDNGKIIGAGENPSESDFIGEEKAKEIAVKSAEINAEDLTYEIIRLEKDDGIWQYEVELRVGRTEYDFDINAETGEIISHDVDYDD